MPRRTKLADFPGLLERYESGETLKSLAASFHAGRLTLKRLLNGVGVKIRPAHAGRDGVAIAFAHGLNMRRRRFRLDAESALIAHELAARLDRLPEEVIEESLRRYRAALTEEADPR